MILLDTNVVSEPLRPQPAGAVVAWIDSQAIETLFLSAIVVAELRFGVATLPAGKRRKRLHEDLEQKLLPLFIGRVLPFDLTATRAYAEMMAKARAAGMAIGISDGYIAAIAATHGLAVATRDTAPFKALGLTVIDPWTSPA